MDTTTPQAINNALANLDNSTRWALAQEIHLIAKHRDKYKEQLNTLKAKQTKKENGLNLSTASETMDDATLRAYVKEHLVRKLGDGSLSASEIGQLKDVFNLASQTEELSIVVESYENAIIDCPHCGENVHKPTCLNASK